MGGREKGDVDEGGNKGREVGREGGREGAMMLCSERASVEERRVEGWRVDEGNERRRDGTNEVSLLRVGSRSRRLWESPPIPTEM